MKYKLPLALTAILTVAGFVQGEDAEPITDKSFKSNTTKSEKDKRGANADSIEVASSFVLPGSEGETDRSVTGESTSASGENDADVDDDVFIVEPTFAVSVEKDDGYYSAHSLGGTRTSALIKDTPMTIEVINSEMMNDLNLNNIDDLTQVLANVQVQADTSFNNRAVVFRGLKTADQMYEFMGREIDQDRYNVERSEIIRGSNSLVYGQASPGGKINFLAKRPQFNKDRTAIDFEYGQYGSWRLGIDSNLVVNDKLAVRVMGVDRETGSYQDLWRSDFTGATLSATYRPTDKTEFHLHLEHVDTFRRFPNNLNVDNTRLTGATGSLQGAPATSRFYEYMTDELKQSYINFQDRVNTGAANTSVVQGNSNIPDFFTSEEDIKNFYETLDVGDKQMGEFIGEDWGRNKDGIYILGDMTHQFSDDLSWKLAASHEQADFDDRVRGGAHSIGLSNFTDDKGNIQTRGTPIYYSNYPNNPNTTDVSTVAGVQEILEGAAFGGQWNERVESDDSTSIRSTFSYTKEIGESRQQFIFGQDLDRRETDRLDRGNYFQDSVVGADGIITFVDSAGNPVSNQPGTSGQLSNFNYGDTPVILPIYNVDANGYFTNRGDFQQNNLGFYDRASFAPAFPIYADSSTYPGVGYEPYGKFIDRQRTETLVDVYALWFANQGTYFNGRLNTLMGVRWDHIETASTVNRIGLEGYNSGNEVTYSVDNFSPTIGFLYWLNDNVSVFANYSQSIEAPTGFQRDIDGNLVQPEIGIGFEGGFKFEAMKGKLNGTLIAFQTDKEEEFSNPGNRTLQEVYPRSAFPQYYADLVGSPPGTGDGGFAPDGFFLAGAEVQVRGVELSMYYNPTHEWSFIFNYGYLETEKTKFALEREEGDTIEGTVPHSANFNVRYEFRDGRLKGLFLGGGFLYRDKSLYDTVHLKDDPNDFERITGKTEIWFSDVFETRAFIGYRGMIGTGRDALQYRIQLNVDNVFDDVVLTARQNSYATLTRPRKWTISGSFIF
ncbi:MAG: TonB-dependent siderophore receptor [Opitutaceae bacterium]